MKNILSSIGQALGLVPRPAPWDAAVKASGLSERVDLIKLRAQITAYLAEHKGEDVTLRQVQAGLTVEAPMEAVAIVLGSQSRAGKLKVLVRVNSPTKKLPVQDFNSLDEVPNSLWDPHALSDITVHSEDLAVVYRIPS